MKSLFDSLPQEQIVYEGFKYITDEKDIPSVIKELEKDKYIYLDTEVATKDLDNIDVFSDKIRLIQLGNEEKIFVIDAFKLNQTIVTSFLKDIFRDRGVIGHNLKFDLKFLKTNYNVSVDTVFDTMIASQILSKGSETDRHSLKAVSNRFAGEDIDKKLQKSDWTSSTLTKDQLIYAAEDIKALRKIFKSMLDRLNEGYTLQKSSKISQIFNLHNPVALLEMAFLPVLVDIELAGMSVNIKVLNSLLEENEKTFQNLYFEFKKNYQIDPFSPQQVANYLVNKLNIKLPKTEKGSYSSQDSVLKNYIDLEEVRLLISIRTVKKIIDKLREIKGFVKDGRVYGEFRQIGASTGRMASMRPNLQNIPASLKKVFQTEKGYKFIIADYSQIELRLAAEYTGDENMIKAFSEGLDLHRLTASVITGRRYEDVSSEDRKLAKAINFGLIYGMSPKSLVEYAKVNYDVEISIDEAKEFHKNFFEYYKNFGQWHNTVKSYLQKHRNIEVSTLLGRKLLAYRFTDAVNYPIQGSGSDLLKMAVVLYYKNKDESSKIVNLVHDEIVIESQEDSIEKNVEILKEAMEKAGKRVLKKVPVAFEVNISNVWEK
ncbi:MAG: bifunctional 3'-5' exonuclease/DNA polymerase [Hydrogenothermaceae bacterium]|nr:bifunctional 3'-5' exonuclease/DNA polymerase [Hydrogenothermaceae bacterium]